MLQAVVTYIIVLLAAGWVLRKLFRQASGRNAAGQLPASGMPDCASACDACDGCPQASRR